MLSKFSVKKPFTVLVAVLIVLIFGCVSFYKMTPDLFPNVNTPYAMVITSYPGASAEEVEMEITDLMEPQMATLTNIKNVSSVSADNFSLVSMEFNDDVNMDAVSVDIRERIDQVKGYLPENAATPVVMKINMDMMPTIVAAVGVKDLSPVEISQLTEDTLMDPLKGTEGVASVTPMGLVDGDIQIVLSQEKIDEINDRVRSSVASQAESGASQVRSGISKAKKGTKDIKDGKDQIKNAAEQMTTALNKLLKQKEELVAAKQANPEDPTIDFQIQAIDEAINQLKNQQALTSFQLSSQYTELSVAESTLNSTVNQLQSTLSEIESAKEAALDATDMTGVLTMNNVSAILAAENFSMPAGYVTDGEAEILVSVGDKIKDKDELNNLILMDMDIDGLEPIRVKDIATVTYASEKPSTYAKVDGDNGILLSFTKQSSYATANVADNIHNTFDKLEKQNKGLHFTALMDQGEYIHVVTNSVLKNLLMGALLAILILLFFLRDIRPTAITAISIPVSVVFAIALMYFSGVTLNMISLSGLAIGVGMLVDNSIVVIENIYRLRSLGYSKVQAAVSGAVQVAGAITASTLTTVCVFVPIVFVDGMTKDIFLDLALTVTYSLLASLIIALTLVPAMAKGLLKKETKKTILSQNGRIVNKYKSLAAWALGHKIIVLAVAFVILILSAGLLLTKGFEFIPPMSTNQISADITLDEDVTLEESSAVNDAIMDEISKIDGVESVGAMLSTGTLGMIGMQASEENYSATSMYIILDEHKLKQGKVVAKKFKELAKKYNCEIICSADMDMTQMMGSAGVSLTLYSDDLDSLRRSATSIESKLKDMKSIEEVSDVNENSTKEIHISVNKNAAMRNGLTVAQVYQQVQSKLAKETTATSLKTNSNSINVNIENTNSGSYTKDDLMDMKITADKQDGSKKEVSLSAIADVSQDASLNRITHSNQKRSITVTATLNEGYNITKVSSQVQKMIKNDDLLEDGVTVEYGGENEEIMHAMKQMLLMLIIGFVLVYLIMVAQFQSLRSPFIIMFTVPLAFTGGLLAMFIAGKTLSVVGMMGFVMLMGIVVNNGIVLVDCINRFRLEGMDLDEAIIHAGSIRMRPVLMTAVTTVLGLVPLALGLGTGAEMVQPVAIVCIGGLIYATLTTLMVVPVMYRILSKKHMEKIEEEELEIVSV